MSTCAEFDNRLIELVRANPSLYERELRKAPYDSSKKKKTELWCSIATSLKTDVSTCITRWNFIREKLRRELLKEHSDWTWLPKLQFIGQHKQHSSSSSHHSSERQIANITAPPTVNWRAQSTEQVIENDEDDALQEAMDEQHASAIVLQPPLATPPPAPATSSSDDAMKRIEALLQGLGANRIKAEKKVLAYLCKCNLRALNDEQIDDIFI
ncbi:transcription factor Adf-1 [Drosophila hydei]|uniref:Transcription factor Adf-1 n=1 Tax=Drosophila hydei TaxID=7224 RepID=A0A6J1M737_DROHY|nr:transcription factor Adf-1 [Drosophila hydei]